MFLAVAIGLDAKRRLWVLHGSRTCLLSGLEFRKESAEGLGGIMYRKS